jgi:hypothetical protein
MATWLRPVTIYCHSWKTWGRKRAPASYLNPDSATGGPHNVAFVAGVSGRILHRAIRALAQLILYVPTRRCNGIQELFFTHPKKN